MYQRPFDNRVNVVQSGNSERSADNRVNVVQSESSLRPPLTPEQIKFIKNQIFSSPELLKSVETYLKDKNLATTMNNNLKPPEYNEIARNIDPYSQYGCICDGCKEIFFGNWYHCSSCMSYDLCLQCFASANNMQNDHLRKHGFFLVKSHRDEIIPQNLHKMYYNPGAWEIVFGQNRSVHSHISCDYCHISPIIGERYNCTVCDNFDLCEKCEASPSKTRHNPSHPMIKYKLPKKI